MPSRSSSRTARHAGKTPMLGLPLAQPFAPASRRTPVRAPTDTADADSVPLRSGVPSSPASRFTLTATGERAAQHGPMDLPLVVTVAGLLLIGLVMVYSASQFAIPSDPGYYFRHQAIWAAMGGVALLITSRVDYHVWRRWAAPGMILALALLALVLIYGHTV